MIKSLPIGNDFIRHLRCRQPERRKDQSSHLSDVERGFPENNHLVSDDRSSLNETSINEWRVTSAGIKFFGDGKSHVVSNFSSDKRGQNFVFKVPVTSLLLSNVREAPSRYAKENEERPKMTNRRKDPKSRQINQKRKTSNWFHMVKWLRRRTMLQEGSKRLANVLSSNTPDDIVTTEALMTAANWKISIFNNQLSDNCEELNRLHEKSKQKWMVEINW